MRQPVLKVARKGYDALVANPRWLTIDSTKNQFKGHIEGRGIASFVAKSPGNTYQRIDVDIEHNLGYQPAYMFLIKKPDGKVRPSPFVGSAVDGPTCASSGVARVDNNRLRLYFYVWDSMMDGYSAFDVEYRYIIFVDPNKNVWS